MDRRFSTIQAFFKLKNDSIDGSQILLLKKEWRTEQLMKHSFKNDYSEIAHPKVLQALTDIGLKQFEGYGLDEHSKKAAEIIREKISAPGADVHFIGGGTHANLVVISSALRDFEAVISVESGHIFQHETGAIEAAGHKICTVKGNNGKLDVSDIENVVAAHEDEHMVKPRLVYISQSAECGTIYKKAELKAISEFCKINNLYLYLDGARLGTALNSPSCDLSYSDISTLTDAFYIGGTKNGALFGEAIIICSDELKRDFRYYMKQRGALMAKGAVIGAQFCALFENGLYDKLAQHANAMAKKIADGVISAGYSLMYPQQTNLIIPVFPSEFVSKLHGEYGFYDWSKSEGKTAIRILTSWATKDSDVDEFIKTIQGL